MKKKHLAVYTQCTIIDDFRVLQGGDVRDVYIQGEILM